MRDYSCAIDIGSSLIRVIVVRDHDDGSLEVIGVGSAPSTGVKNGVIVNIESTVQAIVTAAREAELMSGLVVDEAMVNITGKHLRGENSRGVVAITNRERIVREDDVYRVIEGAQNIRLPGDQEIIHVLSREFTVDDQSGIREPVGMSGVRLEADVHIVTAGMTPLANLRKALAGAGIRIGDGVMSSLASAEAVLSQGEKDLGTAVVDIGGGIIDIMMYQDGGVYFSSIIPVGGIHVTQDLSIGLKLPIDRAEMIKKTYGGARIDGVDPTEKIEIEGLHGRPNRWILRSQIAEIIEPRMKEIFEMVDAELLRSGRKQYLAGGVVLTGGGSLIEGSTILAEEVLGLNVSTGYPADISGFIDRVSGPEFATSLGMLHYRKRMAAPDASVRPVNDTGGPGFFDRLKNWLSDNL